jgi:hypothetical protein
MQSNINTIARSIFLLFLVFSFTLVSAEPYQTVYEQQVIDKASGSFKIFEDFNKGSLKDKSRSGGLRTVGGCYSYSFDLSKNPSGSGKALKTTQKGNKKSYCNKHSKNKHRTEVKIKPRHKFAYKKPMWIGWKTLVPKDFASTSGGVIVSQVMYNDMRNFKSSPDVFLEVRREKWRLNVQSQKKVYTLGSVKRGSWVRWKLYILRSAGKDGELKLWKDNKLVVNLKGKTTRHSNTLGDFKYGVYWGTKSRGNNTYSMYFDDTWLAYKDIRKVARLEPNDTPSQAQNVNAEIPFDAEDTVNSIEDPVDSYAFSLSQETKANIELTAKDPTIPMNKLDASLYCEGFTVPLVSTTNPGGKNETISATIPSGLRCIVAVTAKDISRDVAYNLYVR